MKVNKSIISLPKHDEPPPEPDQTTQRLILQRLHSNPKQIAVTNDLITRDGQLLLKAGQPLNSFVAGLIANGELYLPLPLKEYIEITDDKTGVVESIFFLAKKSFEAVKSLGFLLNDEQILIAFRAVIEQMADDKLTMENLRIISENKPRILERFTTRSIISIIMAINFGLEAKNQINTGIATMFSDFGLLLQMLKRQEDAGWQTPCQHNQHPFWSRQLIINAKTHAGGPAFSPMIANAVLNHHEFLDGSGYPRGRKGAEISLPARIVCIAGEYEQRLFSLHREHRGKELKARNYIFDAIAYLRLLAKQEKTDKKATTLITSLCVSAFYDSNSMRDLRIVFSRINRWLGLLEEQSNEMTNHDKDRTNLDNAREFKQEISEIKKAINASGVADTKLYEYLPNTLEDALSDPELVNIFCETEKTMRDVLFQVHQICQKLKETIKNLPPAIGADQETYYKINVLFNCIRDIVEKMVKI